MSETRKLFEEWWRKKKHLIPASMKESHWLAFADGYYAATLKNNTGLKASFSQGCEYCQGAPDECRYCS